MPSGLVWFPHLRKLVILENVKNILSPSLRSLWNYVMEALLNVCDFLVQLYMTSDSEEKLH